MIDLCPNCGHSISSSTSGWFCNHCYSRYDMNTPKFETIENQLCIMLEQPIPLAKDSKFPCVVRLIQDDSPIGKLNKYEIHILGKKTIIAVEFSENGVVRADDRYFYEHYTRYEILGYPVAEGSAEWAVWQMMHGKGRVR